MEHDDDKFEVIFDRLMREEPLESPSFDFTDKVMDKVYALESESSIVYQPPISKRAWFIIGTCFAAFFAYVLINGSAEGNQWFDNFDVSNIKWLVFEDFEFQFSKILSHALISLALMVGIQVTVLKSYFNNRMTY